MDSTEKPLYWVGTTRDDMHDLPDDVRRLFGFALRQAQRGHKHPLAKPLRGFGGAGVIEIVAAHDGNAYRSVYTVRFERAVYVLHVFQKKSTHGTSTPKRDIDLIADRLKRAQDHHTGLIKGDSSHDR